MDFLPEAISLGAVFGHNHRLGILLAVFIGAQNLPEGFNSFREIVASGARPRAALTALLAISLLGPIAACMGYLFLQDHAKLTAGIMSFAAGGILYIIFQDIAPEVQNAPTLDAATWRRFGFCCWDDRKTGHRMNTNRLPTNWSSRH
jgi:ZIP family zinc transporter